MMDLLLLFNLPVCDGRSTLVEYVRLQVVGKENLNKKRRVRRIYIYLGAEILRQNITEPEGPGWSINH
jgi:hypothetical protein